MMAAPIFMTTCWLPCCEFTPETRSFGVNDCAVLGNVQFATASAQPILNYFSKAKDTIYVSSFFYGRCTQSTSYNGTGESSTFSWKKKKISDYIIEVRHIWPHLLSSQPFVTPDQLSQMSLAQKLRLLT